MNAPTAGHGQSCWTAEYLLCHCEHYRVESVQSKLGYVDRVLRTPDGSALLGLVVRTGGAGDDVVTVPIDDVLELHPEGERIVVREPGEGPARAGLPAASARTAGHARRRRARSRQPLSMR